MKFSKTGLEKFQKVPEINETFKVEIFNSHYYLLYTHDSAVVQ